MNRHICKTYPASTELPRDKGLDVLRNVLLQKGALSVVVGEADSLHSTSWRFAFFHDPHFAAFSSDGKVLDVSVLDGITTVNITSVDGEQACVLVTFRREKQINYISTQGHHTDPCEGRAQRVCPHLARAL